MKRFKGAMLYDLNVSADIEYGIHNLVFNTV